MSRKYPGHCRCLIRQFDAQYMGVFHSWNVSVGKSEVSVSGSCLGRILAAPTLLFGSQQTCQKRPQKLHHMSDHMTLPHLQNTIVETESGSAYSDPHKTFLLTLNPPACFLIDCVGTFKKTSFLLLPLQKGEDINHRRRSN